MGQLHIQQPVIPVVRLGAFTVTQEFIIRLFPSNPVFDAEFIIGQIKLFNTRQIKGVIISPQFFFGVIPEDDAVFFKQFVQCLMNAGIHNL